MDNTPGQINVLQQSGITIVDFLQPDLLDEVQLSEISATISELIATGSAKLLVLDFDAVNHMSSSALGMLIALNKQLKEAGGRIALCNINQEIYKVFSITRLSEMFQIYDSRAMAMAGLA